MDDTFTATVWRHGEGTAGGWHFVTLPADLADALRALYEQGAFGQLPVVAEIGGTSWRTSLFYDTKRASYLLPVKADVRRRERIGDGDLVTVRLAVG